MAFSFLIELPEFKKNALEALRQPLEEGQVTITRSSTTATYPSSSCWSRHESLSMRLLRRFA